MSQAPQDPSPNIPSDLPDGPHFRVPPQSIQAEACVLGSMMLDADAIGTAMGIVVEGDFYRPAHQVIFRVLVEMNAAGVPIDLVSARDEFEKRKLLEQIGYTDYLVALVEGVPTAANVRYYAGIVRDRAILRKLIVVATDAANEAFETVEDPAIVVGRLQQAILELSERGHSADHLTTMSAAMEEAVEHYEAVATQQLAPGLLTGFPRLDEALGGYQPGDLVILAARPSHGKSAMALAWATYAAQIGESILFVSGEMGRRSLAVREFSSAGQIPPANLKSGQLHEAEMNAREQLRAAAATWGFSIFDRSATAGEIAVYARQVQTRARRRLGLVVVDYLQIMRTDPRLQQVDRYGMFAWAMKLLAVDLGCPVVLLSQLNRGKDGENGPPELERLRGSGNIEEHANVVVMLWSAEPYEYVAGGRRLVLARVAKNREGPRVPWFSTDGSPAMPMAFTEHLTRFEELSPYAY
jgi:replicative DNA helicase